MLLSKLVYFCDGVLALHCKKIGGKESQSGKCIYFKHRLKTHLYICFYFTEHVTCVLAKHLCSPGFISFMALFKFLT